MDKVDWSIDRLDRLIDWIEWILKLNITTQCWWKMEINISRTLKQQQKRFGCRRAAPWKPSLEAIMFSGTEVWKNWNWLVNLTMQKKNFGPSSHTSKISYRYRWYKLQIYTHRHSPSSIDFQPAVLTWSPRSLVTSQATHSRDLYPSKHAPPRCLGGHGCGHQYQR